jgi:hypothetical protein
MDLPRSVGEMCRLFSYINEHLTHYSANIGRQTCQIDIVKNTAATTVERSFASKSYLYPSLCRAYDAVYCENSDPRNTAK